MLPHFKSQFDFEKQFNNELACAQYLEQLRWKGTPLCPHCGSEHHYRTKTRLKHPELAEYKDFLCKACNKKYTVLTGSVFKAGKVNLRVWFRALYYASVNKRGISSLQLARHLGITQKTAWFILHRIREMMEDRREEKLTGIVEVDETYIGGKERNKHWDKKIKGSQDGKGKSVIMGLLQRGGRLVMEKIPSAREMRPMRDVILRNVEESAVVVTDSHTSYLNFKEEHRRHKLVKGNTGKKEKDGKKKVGRPRKFSATNNYYVNGIYYTNTIEGFWSHLKNTIRGTYYYISHKHVMRYCGEFGFRYNERNISDSERFMLALSQSNDRRLTYKMLVAEASTH